MLLTCALAELVDFVASQMAPSLCQRLVPVRLVVPCPWAVSVGVPQMYIGDELPLETPRKRKSRDDVEQPSQEKNKKWLGYCNRHRFIPVSGNGIALTCCLVHAAFLLP